MTKLEREYVELVLRGQPENVPPWHRQGSIRMAEGFILAVERFQSLLTTEMRKYGPAVPDPSHRFPAEWYGARKALDDIMRALREGELKP